jgi:PAS domain-containing protein
MIRKENGEPWFIHGVGFDITDLKRTEEALQEERNVHDSRKRAEAKFRGRGTLAGSRARRGRRRQSRGQRAEIVLVNAQVEKLFGYRREELLGQPLELLVPARCGKGIPNIASVFSESRACVPWERRRRTLRLA